MFLNLEESASTGAPHNDRRRRLHSPVSAISFWSALRECFAASQR